jgi:hypothetical protein
MNPRHKQDHSQPQMQQASVQPLLEKQHRQPQMQLQQAPVQALPTSSIAGQSQAPARQAVQQAQHEYAPWSEGHAQARGQRAGGGDTPPSPSSRDVLVVKGIPYEKLCHIGKGGSSQV